MSTESISLQHVGTDLGTAIALEYTNGKDSWWWIGVWSSNRESAAQAIESALGWSKEDRPERGATLFSVVTDDAKQAIELMSKSLLAIRA